MTLTDFLASLANPEPPTGLSPYLLALWYEGDGQWQRAHDTVEPINTSIAAWVHAYLHRKEGDIGNARYWYRHSGNPFPDGQTLEDEYSYIVRILLANQ